MATTLQFRRGTTAQNSRFLGAAGEITVDTDLWQLRIHDGTNVGGHILQGGSSGGGGSVTSVAASGGTTGLTFTGGPIVSSGTLTLGGILAVANGGTGLASPSLQGSSLIDVTGTWPNQTISVKTGTVFTTVPGQNQVLLGDGTRFNLVTLQAGNGITFDQTSSSVLNIRSNATGSGNIITLADLPPGTIQWFAMQAPPSGWLECDGRTLSKTGTYAALWSAIGYTYGGSADNFNLPDLRGQFLRGWDHGRGTDPARAFGSTQADAFKSHDHNAANTGYLTSHRSGIGLVGDTTGTGTLVDYNYQMPSVGGTETRPTNVAMIACIKYTAGVSGNYVTSVNVDGGQTGLTFSGGPITTSGTITMSGQLAITAINATGTPNSTTVLRGDGAWAVPPALGYGQTYQDVTSSRVNNTNYTNSTGKPIWVSVLTGGSPSGAQTNRLYCDGIIIADMNNDTNFQSLLTGIIPPGSVYKTVCAALISRWVELR
jgi:microcystin-dependent protein